MWEVGGGGRYRYVIRIRNLNYSMWRAQDLQFEPEFELEQKTKTREENESNGWMDGLTETGTETESPVAS